MELLRDETFTLYNGTSFRLVMSTVDTPYYSSRTSLAYRLTREGIELFTGSDFGVPDSMSIDGDVTLLTLVALLCARGSVDSEYFRSYNELQLEFMQNEADDLMQASVDRFPEASVALGYDLEEANG